MTIRRWPRRARAINLSRIGCVTLVHAVVDGQRVAFVCATVPGSLRSILVYQEVLADYRRDETLAEIEVLARTIAEQLGLSYVGNLRGRGIDLLWGFW